MNAHREEVTLVNFINFLRDPVLISKVPELGKKILFSILSSNEEKYLIFWSFLYVI